MIGQVVQFWNLVRELDVGKVRAEFEQPARIALRGPEGSGRQTLARALFGADFGAQGVVFQPLDSAAPAAVDLTLLVVNGETDPDIPTRHLAADLAAKGPLLVVLTHADQVADAETRDSRLAALTVAGGARGVWVDTRDAAHARRAVAPALAQVAPARALWLGRRLPEARPLVAENLIRATSRVNAEFALLTNLPAAIPLAGGLVGDAADLVVLTKNQVLLVYKLAGLYGRDLSSLRALLAEILPIVGGAFIWRSVARSAVGLLPPVVAAAPKAAVAFVGTFVVGQMVRYYYEHGARPPAETIARIREEGTRLAGRLLRRRSPGAAPADGQP